MNGRCFPQLNEKLIDHRAPISGLELNHSHGNNPVSKLFELVFKISTVKDCAGVAG
jgi:hypothetical protein